MEGKGPIYLRITAAYASGRAKEKKAVPGLTKLLANEESYFREVAREALTIIGTDEALEAIKQHLSKEDREDPLRSDYNRFYTFDRDRFMDWGWEYED